MRHATEHSSRSGSFPEYYEWKVAGQPFAIYLSFDVIDRLASDVMKGYWAVPKRGAEVGGVLLGRVTDDAVYIDDYEVVACEHRRGPSFVLSEPDRRRLERSLRKFSGRAVGFFRSHTRLGLYLDQDDNALIQTYFAGPKQIMLLMRPHSSKPATAGFFFWEDGNIHRQATYQEFPLDRIELMKRLGLIPPQIQEGEQPQPRPFRPRPVAMESEPEPAALSLPKPARIVQIPSMSFRIPSLPRLPWRKIAIAAAVLIGVGIVEYRIFEAFGRKGGDPVAAMSVSPALKIVPNGRYLQVTWDRRAPAVMNAERGVLTIAEGPYRRDVHLDATQLRNGSVAYSPSGTDVSFRLELMGPRTTVSESLRFVAAVGPEQAATPVPVEAAPAPPVRRPAPVPLEKAAVQPPKPTPAAAVLSAQAAKPAPKPRPRRAYFDDGL